MLLAGNALDAVGFGIFFPIIPLFVQGRGGGPALVGVIGASALIGNLAVQAPAGWLADRFDRRLLVIASMAAYGIFFLVYLIPLPVNTLIGVRFLHAALGGFYLPAARALLADLTPREIRGTVFGHWQGSSMGGFLIGPVIGGGLALIGLNLVFASAALACLGAAALLVSLPRKVTAQEATEERTTGSELPTRMLILLLPAVAAAAAWSYMGGVYGAMWVLYITALGGSPLVAGLSVSIYSLPVLLFSGAAGGLADRYGIRTVVFITLIFGGVFAVGYGFTRSIPVVMALSFAEALFTLGAMPAIYAEVSRAIPSAQQGRAQGLFSMFTIGVQAMGSLGGGFLFGYWSTLPFLSIALVCLITLPSALFLGRGAAAAKAVESELC